MTSASQFSLEEENFYKDIQDLVKKGSQNEKELSTFLQRYMDLLARADLDDETFIINFTKAALILEASTKVYGTKVDRLWINLEQVLDALKVKGKNQNNKKKGENDEEVEEVEGEGPSDDAEPLKKLPNPKRRKKLGDGLTSPDDFHEIDNISGLLGKNMNEDDSSGDVKIKFHEEIPNLFIRNKSDRRRIDVCLVQSTDDRDDSRLRDWIISAENMLVKDMYLAQYLDGSDVSVTVSNGDFPVVRDNIFEVNSVLNSDNELIENEIPDRENVTDIEPVESGNVPDDGNNNVENVPGTSSQLCSLQQLVNEKRISEEYRDRIIQVLNRSHEVEVGKFPNVFVRRIDDYLIDINEVFWNSIRFEEVIPTRKMRVKKTNKIPCQLCSSRTSHVKKGKRCQVAAKNRCLDKYFSPLAQPGVSESPFGILPGEELHSIYKIEMKLLERLGKIENNKNIYEAYHSGNINDEDESFLGFDGVENRLMTSQPSFVDNELMEANDNPDPDEVAEHAELPELDVQLPLPTTENSIPIAESSADDRSLSPDPVLETSRMEYQEIITGELRNQEAAKSQFEKSKELGSKISNWHSSLAKKIEESQKREPFNVDKLAGKILDSFPSTSFGEIPEMSFESLVEGQNQRDISRYFFACLQLTNEGNVDIIKANNAPLATNCMMMRQLRTTRVRHEFDDYTNSTSPKKVDKSQTSSTSSGTQSKRKRNSNSTSSTDSTSGVSQRKMTKSNSNETETKESRKRRLSPDKKSKKKRKENTDSEESQTMPE